MWKLLTAGIRWLGVVAAALHGTTDANLTYKAKDGSYVTIVNHLKSNRKTSGESTVLFYSSDGGNLCSLDFSSSDREHGFGVIKAAWTPDEEYFVFSLASSGGHQAWHKPTLFYTLRDKAIRTLDAYTRGPGISEGDFGLEPPNTVLTTVLREPPVLVKFSLDTLTRVDGESRHSLRCIDGRAFRVNPSNLENHD